MKTIFYGSRQSGMICLLTMKALSLNPIVIAEDKIVMNVANKLNCIIVDYDKLKNIKFDLLVCCHGRKILSKEILKKGICINVHPCLKNCKGARPINQFIDKKLKIGSVGVHYMTEEVDKGEVITEIFKKIEYKTEIEIYNELYPLYSIALIDAIISLNFDSFNPFFDSI